MRLLSSILLFGYGIGLGVATTCNADNCARSVTGTASGLAAQSSHRADCSSFFRVTVTPKTSTVTITRTITPVTAAVTITTETDLSTITTSTVTDVVVVTTFVTSDILAKRQVTVMPSSVPAYASFCSGTSRYSSACSCFGVTKTTITAPTPITTTTATATATATIFATATTIITIPVVATTFVTSTSTIVTCGGVVPGKGSCGCSYTETCNTQFVDAGSATDTSQTSSLAECAQTCDNNFQCAAFTYQKSTGTCVQLKGSYTIVPNADYVSAPITSGSCGGVCTQNYKRDLDFRGGVAEKSRREAKPVGGKKFVGTTDGR